MKSNSAMEMEAAARAWDGATEWTEYLAGWMARAAQPRPVEVALHERLNAADQRIDDLETGYKDPHGIPDKLGWYGWMGVPGMQPTGIVQFMCRDGSVGIRDAQWLDWEMDGSCREIVKWKPSR